MEAQRETTTKEGQMATAFDKAPQVSFNDGTYTVVGLNDKGYITRFDGFATQQLAEEFAPLIRMGATNPVVFTDTAYGHTIRRYANGMWDACDGPVANLSPGFETEDDLRYWLATETAKQRDEAQRLRARAVGGKTF